MSVTMKTDRSGLATDATKSGVEAGTLPASAAELTEAGVGKPARHISLATAASPPVPTARTRGWPWPVGAWTDSMAM